MKLSNPIGWCDDTTNAVTGCDKISPGCKNCYAATGTRARVLRHQGIETWGAAGSRVPVAGMPEKLRRLNKLCVCDKCHEPSLFPNVGRIHKDASSSCGGIFRRIRLFADSNSDWLDDQWPIEILANFLDQIRQAPNVDVLLLTKRPENFPRRIREVMVWVEPWKSGDDLYHWLNRWVNGGPPPGVWLGTSVESQKYADHRIPELLKIPAAIRFASCEPLLEPLNVMPWLGTDANEINWFIVGGESGTNRRDCGAPAIEQVARQCVSLGVSVYVKQDCAFHSGQQGRIPDAIWHLKQFPHPGRAVAAAPPQINSPAEPLRLRASVAKNPAPSASSAVKPSPLREPQRRSAPLR